MKTTSESKLTRREFAGVLAALAPLTVLPLGAQEKKAEETKPPAVAPPEEEFEARALKAIREFKLRDGAEPAFVFRADWNRNA
jgi:hypothetical protein